MVIPPPPEQEEEKSRTYFWGSSPGEDEYYASHGIRSSQSFYTSPRGLKLFTRSWEPLSNSSNALRGVVCMVHGYGNDISWTFQSTPIFLARHGFACFAIDLEGHGRSDGLRAFVPDVDAVLSDLISYFASVLAQPHLRALPRFLYGESMGGALCLLIHLHHQQQLVDNTTDSTSGDDTPTTSWDGAVLVAPMCKISDNIRPPWPIPQILTFAARFAPTLPIVPTADLLDKSVKVAEKKVVAGMNPLRYRGRPRLGTVVELLRITDYLHSRLSDVTIPFLVVHGSADVVTDPGISKSLYEAARSADKNIKIYDGMMHSLLFGEPDDNVEMVRGDILSWLSHRCATRGGGSRMPADNNYSDSP